MLICAGGVFQFRSDENEGTPVAGELASRGYQSFVVNDEISADVAADGMIYSFYDRLSVSDNDVQTLKNGELPPAFYCYGMSARLWLPGSLVRCI